MMAMVMMMIMMMMMVMRLLLSVSSAAVLLQGDVSILLLAEIGSEGCAEQRWSGMFWIKNRFETVEQGSTDSTFDATNFDGLVLCSCLLVFSSCLLFCKYRLFASLWRSRYS